MSWNASEREGGIRAGYGSETVPGSGGDADACRGGALVRHVVPGSPAHTAGIRAGMVVESVKGQPLLDIIDWFWQADGLEVSLEARCPDGSLRTFDLVRTPPVFCVDAIGAAHGGDAVEGASEAGMPGPDDGDWGIEFSGNVFDGVRVCRNACTFCFMSMLPAGMRPSLYLRDDDYRLSFLQGNFVTLTNIDDADVQRIIELGLAPLHVSLHAIDPAARRALMGNNHARGLAVLDALLAAGLDIHVQVVLVPGVNDGAVLDQTLEWAVAQQQVLSLGIVPVGFTRFQDRFGASYANSRAACEVIEQVAGFQERCRQLYGVTKIHVADEFYANAYGGDVADHLPGDAAYDGYPQFQDGIGMLRTLIDGWQALDTRVFEAARQRAHAQEGQPAQTLVVSGTALAPVLQRLVAAAGLDDVACVVPVENDFFGGNVDVSGLLTGRDVVRALHTVSAEGTCRVAHVVLPDAMFNDDGLTLDDMTSAEVADALGLPVRVVCYNASEIAESIG